MDKTSRVLRMVLGSGICAVLVPRRPVSGPRVPGYHTRAGGHRHSPLIPVPDPVPQERWGDYAGGVLGCGKIGREKMCGVNGNNGLSGNRVEIFPPLRELRVRQFCTATAVIGVPAWIPGSPPFASLVLRPRMTRWWVSQPIANVVAGQRRNCREPALTISEDLTCRSSSSGRSTSEAKGEGRSCDGDPCRNGEELRQC